MRRPAVSDDELVRLIRGRPMRYPLGAGEAEELAVEAGIKPVFRQLLPAGATEAARQRCSEKGLTTEVARGVSSQLLLTHAQTGADGEELLDALYAGRDATRVKAAARCESVPSEIFPVAELGLFLGYPECCVRAFDRFRRPIQRVPEIERSLFATKGACDLRTNELDSQVFHYISWIPCAFDCAHTLAYAAGVARILRERDAAFASDIERALGAFRLYVSHDVQVSMTGEWDGAELSLRAVWPTAADRHPRSPPLSPAREQSVARWLRLLRPGGRLQLDRRKVYIDGRRWADLEPAALVPFGAVPQRR